MEKTQLGAIADRRSVEIRSITRRVADVDATENNSGCLHELFEARVDETPEAPALIFENRAVSYRELEILSNRLAHYLRHYGVGPGKLVGLFYERSLEPIISILACLKAGAAYVPIDPVYPPERIRHILQESELSVILTEKSLDARAAELFEGNIIATDDEREGIGQQSGERLTREQTGLSPHDLCYVIYTSGTTGRPKGVMTEHRGAHQFVRAFNEVCGVTAEERVYQGFSLGFDGSIEEIWMAFSNGAALVVGNRQTARFGNELAQFLAQNEVTYFSTVPTLLSTMTEDIPTLRQLIVSGEMCPSELVTRWARQGRKMWNVYGPTEATVNTTAALLSPGRPVNIGRALNGYHTYVLDPQMRPLPHGETGELFIGGNTLARGYLKQAGLTAERFVTNPHMETGSRLYRTGDLVRFNPDGDLEIFGRIDTQVKIRGYRVELAEIEQILLEFPSISSASVTLFERDGLQELAAFVVLSDPKTELNRETVLETLESRLPIYMIPGFLDVLAELPMLTSGKVDRKRLPKPISPLVRVRENIVPPATPMETKIAAVWSKLFGVPRVSVEDDFFLDLGGHSLVAAQMVNQLREKTRLEVAVRDVYRLPTVRKLAGHLEALSRRSGQEKKTAVNQRPSAKETFHSVPIWERWTVMGLQAVSMLVFAFLGALPITITVALAYAYVQNQISVLTLVVIYVALLLFTWPIYLTISIAAKWLLVGRYKAGEHKVWSFYYFRLWFAGKLIGMSGVGLLAGTPLMPIYFRLMGAKVGRRCLIDSAACSSWDLITIGDDTSICADSQYLGYRIERGVLTIGPVTIGSRCFIGIHSTLGIGSRMEDDTRLDDQSMLPDGAVIPKGEGRKGSPAQPAEVKVPEGPELDRHPVLYSFLHILLTDILVTILFIPFLPVAAICIAGYVFYGWWGELAALVTCVPLGFFLYCFMIAGMKKMVLSRIEPGVYPVESWLYLRKWLSDGVMKFSKALLLPLYTTMYLPPWLRLMGAKIGKRAELSTVWTFSPELVDIGAESFFADGSIIGGKRFFRGRFEVGINKIGRRSFVGNSAILPVGASLGDGCLLGVVSAPPTQVVPDNTDWLGSPSFALPNRQQVGNFDPSVTYQPTWKLYMHRALVDGLRILYPSTVALTETIAVIAALYYIRLVYGLLALFLAAPPLAIAASFGSCVSVIVLKWVLMGRFQPVVVPLWSPYVWWNEMLNGAYESIMSPFLTFFLGTPFVVPFLRAMGCKIGKHTYIESALFSEFDLVEVEDYASLNVGSLLQTHLFEDRVMKSAALKVGESCTVGNMGVVLYNAEMKKESSLGPLSLLMKGETLPEGTRWHGIPTIQTEGAEA